MGIKHRSDPVGYAQEHLCKKIETKKMWKTKMILTKILKVTTNTNTNAKIKKNLLTCITLSLIRNTQISSFGKNKNTGYVARTE